MEHFNWAFSSVLPLGGHIVRKSGGPQRTSRPYTGDREERDRDALSVKQWVHRLWELLVPGQKRLINSV